MRAIIRQKIVDSLASPVPVFTPRDVRLPRIPGKATAVIGMRRTGKTTFLWQVLAERLKHGTARQGLLYFNFEDERLAGLSSADLQMVVEEYYRLHPEWRDRWRAVFFLDEIQAVPGWETFARRILDTEKVELFVSGSSARLLSREVATSMRGRAMEALHACKADAVDLNMGCPASAVGKFGAGISLMEQPENVRSIVAEARRRTSLPLTAKIRLGADLDEEKLWSFCSLLEDEGIYMVSVHARLKHESFARNPRWERITGIKERLTIPVIANGGIFSIQDARDCLRISGAESLATARHHSEPYNGMNSDIGAT